MLTRGLLVGALWLSVEGGALALEGSQGAAEPERYEAVPELSVGEMDGPVALTRVDPQFGFYTVERLRLERIDAGFE